MNKSNSMKDVTYMLSTQEKQKLKEELMDQKNHIQGQLDDREENPANTGDNENGGELSLYDNHPADMGSELYEREKDFALDEHSKSELNKIDDALKAMDEGSYGTCKECGEEIPFERLEAIPTTLYCKDHANAQSIVDDRPAEEDILQPPVNGEFRHETGQLVRDTEDSFQEVGRFGTSETPSDFQGDHDDYSDLYEDDDETEGFTEDMESFVGTDMDGKNTKAYPSKAHEEYEDMLDENDMESTIGDIPYKERDSYVSDKKKS